MNMLKLGFSTHFVRSNDKMLGFSTPPRQARGRSKINIFTVPLGLCVMVLAVALVFLWGRYGFGIYDMSFMIDAAYRILHGQKMYVDIGGLGHGPITYYLQAAFLKMFGVNFMSFLVHAAVINGIASGIVYFYFARRLAQPWPSILGGLTAIWFYGLVAWPFPERISFLAALVIFIMWENLWDNRKHIEWKFLVIGLLTAFPLWDKQNIALALTIVNTVICTIFIVRTRTPKLFIWYILGYVIMICGLFLFFYLNGLDRSIFEYFQRPFSFNRFQYLLTRTRAYLHWPSIAVLAVAVYIYQLTYRQTDDRIRWLGVLSIGVALLQALSSILKVDGLISDFPLAPFLVGWLIMLMEETQGIKGPLSLARRCPLITAAIIIFLFSGVYYGFKRAVWAGWAWPQATAFAPVKQPFFSGLMMQQPEADELNDLLGRLQERIRPEETFWVFPSYVSLYAAMGRVSTAPMLSWELRGIAKGTIRLKDEAKTIEWLEKTRPDWFVYQQKPAIKGDMAHELDALLKALPRLKEFIVANYEHVEETKAFEIYKIIVRAEPRKTGRSRELLDSANASLER